MIWCLLGLAVFVTLDVLGLRWFYATHGDAASCHCHQPWRGEYIANFGHPPEDVRLAPPAPVLLAPPFRTPLRRLQPGRADAASGIRSAPVV